MGEHACRKILYVITKSNWGGAQRYVYDLATNLNKEEFEVSVALAGDGLLSKRLTSVGIRVIPLANVQRDLSVGADTAGFRELYRTIKVMRPDVVHLNSSKAGGLGALAARLLGTTRIIFTAHGWPFEERRSMAWRIFAYLGSWATALLSHEVIVISKKDLVLGRRMPLCAHKMHLIYNGIGPMQFGSGDVIRHSFPSGVRITGTVGELNKNKNQVSLIDEAKRDPSKYVAIVGDGEERANLEQKIAENGLGERVKLFGFMPAEEVLHGFDEFALPSLKEGLPYVLLEAKAANLPIFANRVGGVGDILDAKDMGEFTLEEMVRKTTTLYKLPA